MTRWTKTFAPACWFTLPLPLHPQIQAVFMQAVCGILLQIQNKTLLLCHKVTWIRNSRLAWKKIVIPLLRIIDYFMWRPDSEPPFSFFPKQWHLFVLLVLLFFSSISQLSSHRELAAASPCGNYTLYIVCSLGLGYSVPTVKYQGLFFHCVLAHLQSLPTVSFKFVFISVGRPGISEDFLAFLKCFLQSPLRSSEIG